MFSQEKQNDYFFDVNYFRGNIALHNPTILHLIKGRPQGGIIGWNKKTYGTKAWQQRYNYPDYGVSLSFQDYANPVLGASYALHGHVNFYFLKRHLMFRVAQGFSYSTNPYDKEDNPKNNAFGSDILSSTYLMLNYKKDNVFKQFGFQTGLMLMHNSNGNTKAPNTSINTVNFNFGMTYDLSSPDKKYIESKDINSKFTESIKYNLVFRGGVNQNDLVGNSQFPFYIFSAYADKRLSYKSALQFGAEVFFSNFLKNHIRYRSIAFPDQDFDPDADFKRVGIFIGHELFVSKISVITQLGYYAYYPYPFENRVYLRAGLKYYFYKNWFGTFTVKSHGAAAEAAEFAIGIRL